AHPSKALRDIIEGMNHFSNNFVAEQIVFALGQQADGSFVHEQGVDRIKRYLRSIGVAEDEIGLVDGSGLDRDNRLSAHAIVQTLRAMARKEFLDVEFMNSFSVAGRNGTLRERGQRSLGSRPGSTAEASGAGGEAYPFYRGKTGTLNGASSLAGYVRDREGRLYAFALLYNGDLPKQQVVEIEDRFVEILYASKD
ncbi:MAG: D-alanyl-D-alanine carboxypeptidase, partial [Oligoflexia bacterium]|nr:D-alanyl-D-alanine carboxypeptidase [Oligoflexia bacterium]